MLGYQSSNFLISIYCLLLLLGCLVEGQPQLSFEAAFANCRRSSPEFDSCIKDALNAVRPYFKTGVSDWNLPPLDPFFTEEVAQHMGTPSLNYDLKLINATEAGWTESMVTDFRTDFNNNLIKYTQYFPAKFLKGMYEFSATIYGRKVSTSGYWTLALYGFVQTTTITREAVNDTNVINAPLKVKIHIHSTKDMKLHISNLLGGSKQLEVLLDRIINVAWSPGFYALRPIINDLVGTAFTGIFNKGFKDFQFDQLINY